MQLYTYRLTSMNLNVPQVFTYLTMLDYNVSIICYYKQ